MTTHLASRRDLVGVRNASPDILSALRPSSRRQIREPGLESTAAGHDSVMCEAAPRAYWAIENFWSFGAFGPWDSFFSGIFAFGSGLVPRRMYSVTGL